MVGDNVKVLAEALVVVAEHEMKRFRLQEAAQDLEVEAMRGGQRVIVRDQNRRAATEQAVVEFADGRPRMQIHSDELRLLFRRLDGLRLGERWRGGHHDQ